MAFSVSGKYCFYSASGILCRADFSARAGQHDHKSSGSRNFIPLDSLVCRQKYYQAFVRGGSDIGSDLRLVPILPP